ncbi:MAG: excinuclease ABC subunit UvrA [Deltaproteobacteria bacterium]|nr:excinuclease ABC subunit UvrA [Deltaproteobacteria bacterium]MBW2393153.1 excinuclease ABC subunit UvrA [Deltaproteobacteria bacterium]
MDVPAIRIENARTHNLRNASCTIPLYSLTVVSGVSGSGKSSLAFDTLYAEGQRRYVASLSTYARQFLERLPRPDVDLVSNLPPAIAIEQHNSVTNARSTVGTATEILDHLRLLYAKVGETFCCDSPVEAGTVQSWTERLLERFSGQRGSLAVALRPEEPAADLRERLGREGWNRLLDRAGNRIELDDIDDGRLDRERADLLSVVDRLAIAEKGRSRLAEALAAALGRGFGEAIFVPLEGEAVAVREGFVCEACGRRHPTPQPALFSFNSPLGACSACQGFGRVAALDLEKVVPDPSVSLKAGGIAPFATPSGRSCQRDLMRACPAAGVDPTRSWRQLGARQRAWVIEGDDDWYGIRGYFEYLESRRYKVQARIAIARYRKYDPCPECEGYRLRREALEVLVGGRHLGEVSTLTIEELGGWLGGLKLDGGRRARGERLLALLEARVGTALEVGLGYLSLARQMRTLSGGEAQRIQLATALGGGLTSALYVLDEPSVGLHPRDVGRLLGVLRSIRDQGNTLVVVEHAPEIVSAADHLVDLGPGAGREGGQVVAEGTVEEVAAQSNSPTARLLAGKLKLERRFRPEASGSLRIEGASAQNLQDVDVSIPLGQLVAVTGVSGAGKSTLIRAVLVGQLLKESERGPCKKILGGDQISEVVVVEPTPPGRSARSNPATISKAFDGIRKRFAATAGAKRRGLAPGWFSFNVPGGRCEPCEGSGETVVDMQFLEDVRIPCEHCDGTRYKPEVREVTVNGLSIVDVLALSVQEARERFANEKTIGPRLEPLCRVGLGYLTLAQPLSTLSGGELQRLRIAQALAAGTPGALYVMDEPTTGLHVSEIQVLISCLDALLDSGASVVLIEHNLDVIRVADWIIDLGPEGGPGGGRILAEGPPAAIAQVEHSYTGAALRGEFG